MCVRVCFSTTSRQQEAEDERGRAGRGNVGLLYGLFVSVVETHSLLLALRTAVRV